MNCQGFIKVFRLVRRNEELESSDLQVFIELVMCEVVTVFFKVLVSTTP
jgi:hypothetical protein